MSPIDIVYHSRKRVGKKCYDTPHLRTQRYTKFLCLKPLSAIRLWIKALFSRFLPTFATQQPNANTMFLPKFTLTAMALSAIFLLSCGNKEPQPADFFDLEQYESSMSVDSLDSPYIPPRDSVVTPPPAAATIPQQSASSSRSSSYHYEDNSREDDDDNMRGWDTPSEDDLDDNGMSRYMENNDDEGWE